MLGRRVSYCPVVSTAAADAAWGATSTTLLSVASAWRSQGTSCFYSKVIPSAKTCSDRGFVRVFRWDFYSGSHGYAAYPHIQNWYSQSRNLMVILVVLQLRPRAVRQRKHVARIVASGSRCARNGVLVDYDAWSWKRFWCSWRIRTPQQKASLFWPELRGAQNRPLL